MNAIIYGAGKRGQDALIYLREKYEVLCFIDDNKELLGKFIQGVRILSLEEFLQCPSEADIIFFALDNDRLKKATQQLRHTKVNQAYMIRGDFEGDTFDEFYNKLIQIDMKKPRLFHLDISLAYICNLNCRGCCHYSNIYEGDCYPDFSEVEKDFEQLKRLYWGCRLIHLMGGEPLLNKDASSYVIAARRFSQMQ